MKALLKKNRTEDPASSKVVPFPSKEANEKTILVADPDPKMIPEMLQLFPHDKITFVRALGADELMRWLKVCTPEVLLLSTELPGMDIGELISIVKIIHPRVPIIAMTGQDSIDLDIERSLRKEGIFYFFHKSFGFDELKTAIGNAVKTLKRVAGGRAVHGL